MLSDCATGEIGITALADSAEVRSGIAAAVEAPGPDRVPATAVFAPPEACTTPAGWLESPGCVREFVDPPAGADNDDPDAAACAAAPDDVDAPDEEEGKPNEPVDESFDEELSGPASAIPGLLAIAMPSPSEIANAPTRPK